MAKGKGTHRYEWRMHSQTNNRFTVADHQAVVTRDYTGPGLHQPHNVKGKGAVTFPPIDVPAKGMYYVWVLCRGQSYLAMTIDGKHIGGRIGPYPTRGQHWQWQPWCVRLGKNKERVKLELSEGKHELTMPFGGWRGTDVAKILLTTDADFTPFYSADTSAQNSVVVLASSATQVDGPWERVEPLPTSPMTIAFLNPAPVTFDTTPYRYRTVHFGKQWIRIPMLMATRKAANPYFLVMLYPRDKNGPEPRITRTARAGAITATIAWPTATDTIVRPTQTGMAGHDVRTDSLVALVRRPRKGAPSFFMSLGTRLEVGGKAVVVAPGKVSLACHEGTLVLNPHEARGELVIRWPSLKRVAIHGKEQRIKVKGGRFTMKLGQ
jgi:hypothetical protein